MKRMKTIIITATLAALTAGCSAKQALPRATDSPVVTETRTARQTQLPPEQAAVASPTVPQGVEVADMGKTDVGKAGNTDKTEAVEDLQLKPVYFPFDSWIMSSSAREDLARNAKLLDAKKSLTVVLEGHTDERGSDAYNLALGEKRAVAVQNFLVLMGISSNRFTVVSYGEEKPAAKGVNEEAWALNRRVEFRIQQK